MFYAGVVTEYSVVGLGVRVEIMLAPEIWRCPASRPYPFIVGIDPHFASLPATLRVQYHHYRNHYHHWTLQRPL